MNIDTVTRRQTRLFAFLACSASIGLLMGLAFGWLLLDGQAAHERDRRASDAREVTRQADEDRRTAEAFELLQEVKTATAAAEGALAAIKDCTTAGGECKKQGEAATARAIELIVSRINTALAGLNTVSVQNTELQHQVTQLVAEAAQLRVLLEQQSENPHAPAPVVPSTPLLCQLIRC